MSEIIDNADPVEQANELLKIGLYSLSKSEKHSEYSRRMAGDAVDRICELEQQLTAAEKRAEHYEQLLNSEFPSHYAGIVERRYVANCIEMGMSRETIQGKLDAMQEEAAKAAGG